VALNWPSERANRRAVSELKYFWRAEGVVENSRPAKDRLPCRRTKIVARSAICATGVAYRQLGLPNEEQYFGAACTMARSERSKTGQRRARRCGGAATRRDRPLCTLLRLRSGLSLVIRGESLKSTLSQYLVDRVFAAANVECLREPMSRNWAVRLACRRSRSDIATLAGEQN